MLVRYALAILLGTVVPVSAQQIQLTGRSGNVTAQISGNVQFMMGDIALRLDDAKLSLKLENGIVTGQGLGTCTVRSSSLELNASRVAFELQHDEVRFQVADAMTGVLKINPNSDFSFTAESVIKLKSKNLSLSSSRAKLEFSDGLLRIMDADEETASHPSTSVAPPNDGSWGIETPPTNAIKVR